MIFSTSISIFFLFVLIFINFGNLFWIREIIWSIVWCDKGGKYNSLKKVQKGRHFFEKINMKYLEQYTNAHRKNFVFWIRVKTVYIMIETAFFIVYVMCAFFLKHNIGVETIIIFIIVQPFLLSIVLVFQSDLKRKTKYDRIRENNHNKQHKH